MYNHTTMLLALVLGLALMTTSVVAQQIQIDRLPPASQQAPEPGVAAPRVMGTLPSDRQWTPAVGQEPPSDTTGEEVLMPLRPRHPQGRDGKPHRLQGEYPSDGFWLYLPRAIDSAELEITTLSSINLLPERSVATVSVNGSDIGTLRLNHFSSPGGGTLKVPSGILKAGRNLVELRLEQVHRVFCGPEASFGLWTDVFGSQSGIKVLKSDLGLDPLSFVAAEAAQLGNGGKLTLAISNPTPIFGSSPAAARFERLFGGMPPSVLISDYYSVVDGSSELARITALPADPPVPSLPDFRRGGDGAIVLLANSDQTEEVEALLSAAVGQPPREASLPEVVPGKLQSLADLGVPALVGKGHYILREVPFLLPWDWLVMTSEKAQIRLEYAFTEGLPQGSLLMVKINGQTISLLPLDDAQKAGRRLDTLRVPFPANLLEPGANELTFEALVPGEVSDAACAPQAHPVFEVFDTTSLRVPNSPKMTLPRLDRALDTMDVEGITMSEGAQRALPIGLFAQVASIYGGDESDDTAQEQRYGKGAIKIGIPADLSTIPGDIVRKNVTRLEEVLLSVPEVDDQEIDLWARAETHGLQSLFESPKQVMDKLRELRGKVISLWRGPESDLDSWLVDRSAEAMLIQPSMDEPEKLWLVVRPNIDYERLVSSLLENHRSGEGPKGQISLFGRDGSWQVWTSANRPFTLLEPLTLSNARAIAGNYVTLSPSRYIGPLFILALGCALSAVAILVRRRRKN